MVDKKFIAPEMAGNIVKSSQLGGGDPSSPVKADGKFSINLSVDESVKATGKVAPANPHFEAKK